MSNCPNSISNYVNTINDLIETRWVPKGITNRLLSDVNVYQRNKINLEDLKSKQNNNISEVVQSVDLSKINNN